MCTMWRNFTPEFKMVPIFLPKHLILLKIDSTFVETFMNL